jgi:hypothetical protein
LNHPAEFLRLAPCPTQFPLAALETQVLHLTTSMRPLPEPGSRPEPGIAAMAGGPKVPGQPIRPGESIAPGLGNRSTEAGPIEAATAAILFQTPNSASILALIAGSACAPGQ